MHEQWGSDESPQTGPPPSAGGSHHAPKALRLFISTPSDVIWARSQTRLMARSLGFSHAPAEKVVLAVSELAANLVRHARWGELLLTPIHGPGGEGIEVESRDRGPGIPDPGLAMQNGFSTARGLGIGLPGVRRLMDEFAMTTGPNGTTIVVRKWTRVRRH